MTQVLSWIIPLNWFISFGTLSIKYSQTPDIRRSLVGNKMLLTQM